LRSDEQIRSYLFVPGDRPALLEKADQRGADALVVDLEDAVAPSRKEEARACTAQWLEGRTRGDTQIWVRINGDSSGLSDLESMPGDALEGVMIPKAAGAKDVIRWSGIVDEALPGSRLIVLIETAAALRHLDEIAVVKGVSRLMIGEADLGADTGIASDDLVWDALRADVVVASAAARLPPPIGPVDPDFSSPEALEAGARRLKSLGFGARALIHPAQIAPTHRGLRPTEQEVAEALRIVNAHDESLARGEGVHLGADGIMLDEAYVRRARSVLAAHDVEDDQA
jgi:citrate lyase subunit beta/citryl-CoA lyase